MSRQPPLVPSTAADLDYPADSSPIDADGTPGGHAPRLQPGELIERYIVEAWIGDGGAASVYRVRHRTLETLHALKVPHQLRPDLLERLVAEGRLQARLVHPNIIRVQDVIEVRGAPALLMDYAEGPDLAQLLRDAALPFPRIEALFRGILEAVAYAHDRGVVHRDLKPGNVLLVRDGEQLRPRVTDFGIARHFWTEARVAWTRTGALLGTPDYMAPEQLRQTRQVDQRADLFSLGVMLYEMCCSRRPFGGPDLLTLLNAMARAEYIPPLTLRPDLPAHLAAAIEACLVAAPDERVPDCVALVAILDGAAPSEHMDVTDGQAATGHTASGQTTTPPLSIPTAQDGPALEPLDVPKPSRAPWVAVAAVLLILLAALAAQTWRMGAEGAAHESQLELERLRTEAWRLAPTRPAEALAMLLGAAAQGRADDFGPDGAGDSRSIEAGDAGAAKAGGTGAVQAGGSGAAQAGGAARVGNGRTLKAPAGLSTEEVYRLLHLGAASYVIPARDQALALALSPDASIVAGALLSGELVLWDRRTGSEKLRIDAGIGRPVQVRFTSSGDQIVVVPEWGSDRSDDRLPLRSFDVATGKLRFTLSHGMPVTRLVLSPDGSRAITASWNTKIRVWNLKLGNPESSLDMATPGLNRCMAISADNTLVAISDLQDFLLAEVATGRTRAHLRPTVPLAAGCELAFSPDGSFLVVQTPGGSETLRISGQPLVSTIEQLLGHPMVFGIDPGGKFILSGDRGPSIQIRSLPSLKPVSSLMSHTAGIVEALFSPDGRYVTTASNDAEVVTWETLTGRRIRAHLGHGSRVLALEQSRRAGDDLIITGSRDETVRLWSRATIMDGLPPLERLTSIRSALFSLSRDGSTLASYRDDGKVHVQRLDGTAEVEIPGALPESPADIALSPDGKTMVLESASQILTFTLGGSPTRVARQAGDGLMRWIDIGPDLRHFIVFGGDDAIRLYELGTDSPPVRMALPGIPFRATLLPGGARIVAGTRYGKLVRLDVATPDRAMSSDVSKAGISALRPLSDGRQVLVGDWDGAFFRWDTGTSTRTLTFTGHSDGILRIELSPDGHRVASLSWDRTIRLWDLASGRPQAILDHGSSDPTLLAFSPDGERLITGARDGSLRLWDVRSGRLIALRTLQTSVTGLAYPPDGRITATDLDGLAYRWDLSKAVLTDPLELAARLTNLRLCPGTTRVVPVIPFPGPDLRLAPPEACRTPEESDHGTR